MRNIYADKQYQKIAEEMKKKLNHEIKKFDDQEGERNIFTILGTTFARLNVNKTGAYDTQKNNCRCRPYLWLVPRRLWREKEIRSIADATSGSDRALSTKPGTIGRKPCKGKEFRGVIGN